MMPASSAMPDARDRVMDVGALLAPRNVVLVGASDRPGHWSGRVMQNLERFGFAGEIFVVNPNRDSLWGRPVHPDLKALPQPPDHLALFVPAALTMEILDQGSRLGVRSATLYAAGFGEGGDAAGRGRAQALAGLLRRTGIAAAGPNCMGVSSAPSRLVTIPDETLPLLAGGPIAVVTQSGMLCATFARALGDRGLGVSHLVSCGNQTGLTFADYIDHFAADPALRVVICYIEALPDAERFFAAARAARTAGKTIVVVKAGVSEEGRSAALAHTGALAGNAVVFDGLAREAGIVRIRSLEETVEAAEFLARAPRPRAARGGFMTNSGAMKSLMTDAAILEGLGVPALSETTLGRLREILGEDADVGNPLDTKKTLPTAQYLDCIRAFQDSGEVDFLVLVEELPRDDTVERKISNLQALDAHLSAHPSAIPVVTLSPIALRSTDYMTRLLASLTHVPMLRDLGKSFRTIAALARSGEALPAQAAGGPKDINSPPAGTRALNEIASKDLLARFGIAIAPEAVAQSPRDAVDVAKRLGYPVVVKAVSSAIPHKSDAGLVHLGLACDDEVRVAAAAVKERCAELGAPLEGILVARHLSGGAEMVLGIHRDPEFGPVVMAGMGGVWLEVFKDVAFAPPTLDLDGALRAIRSTRAFTLLDGYRGASRKDVRALAEAMVALGRMAREMGEELEAVDLNPMLVLAEGKGAFALDGLVVLRQSPR